MEARPKLNPIRKIHVPYDLEKYAEAYTNAQTFLQKKIDEHIKQKLASARADVKLGSYLSSLVGGMFGFLIGLFFHQPIIGLLLGISGGGGLSWWAGWHLYYKRHRIDALEQVRKDFDNFQTISQSRLHARAQSVKEKTEILNGLLERFNRRLDYFERNIKNPTQDDLIMAKRLTAIRDSLDKQILELQAAFDEQNMPQQIESESLALFARLEEQSINFEILEALSQPTTAIASEEEMRALEAMVKQNN